MKHTSRASGMKQAFTLIELLIVIAIIAILASILFPVFARARENARRASCLSNMKQIGIGTMQYVQDYDERISPTGGPTWNGFTTVTLPSWRQRIYPYIKSTQVFRCPSRKIGAGAAGNADPTVEGLPAMPISYAVTGFTGTTNGLAISGFQEPSRKLMVIETPRDGAGWGSPNWTGGCPTASVDANWTDYWVGNNTFLGHLGTLNYLFMDGHVKSYQPSQTATPYNMWGASNCVGGIPNETARLNYSTPDPVITNAMAKIESKFN